VSLLRVDLVSEHANPLAAVGGADAGGQNVHVAALATHLAELDCEVTVLTRADDPRVPTHVPLGPGVVVEHMVAGPVAPVSRDDMWKYMPVFARQLRHRWRRTPPDVVHSHFWMSGWAAARARAGLAPSPPLVHTYHALGAVKRRHQGGADTSPAVRCEVESQLAQQVDHIVATCNDEVAELAAAGADASRITVVPCGVDTAAFTPTGPMEPPRRGGHRIVVVSRLVARKGIDDVIAALPRLPGTELLVAGGPPAARLAGDAEARRLTDLARHLGVGDRLHLLGAVPHDGVPSLLRSADLVACVPWYEPFGIVPVEAMACGIPVIGSAVGGLLDTVDDRRTGILVPPHDSEAVAAAAARLLGNPSLRVHMGAEAVARVKQEYTWIQVAWSTLGVYQRLAAGGDGRVVQHDRGWAVPA
jgi:D-inositol-3-phosphate glycosyltransferase